MFALRSQSHNTHLLVEETLLIQGCVEVLREDTQAVLLIEDADILEVYLVVHQGHQIGIKKQQLHRNNKLY